FTGFELDDFNNGVGQLDVSVNGQLVVDIPAGLNHLTGTGDYKAYENAIINFGPFDITSFIVDGQNTILFKDQTLFDHNGVVRNITIVNGDSVLLHSGRARGVYPAFSFSYTFSSQHFSLCSRSALTPARRAVATFSASLTGLAGPFNRLC